MDDIQFPHLTQVLNDFARDAKENYRSALRSSDHIASGALQNFEATVVQGDKEFRVEFDLEKYWKYVEHGTRPHWPPQEPILKWIEVKPVIPRPGRDGRIPSPKQLAYLIRRKIAAVGTAGTHDLERSRDATLAWYEQRIIEAVVEDLQAIVFYEATAL